MKEMKFYREVIHKMEKSFVTSFDCDADNLFENVCYTSSGISRQAFIFPADGIVIKRDITDIKCCEKEANLYQAAKKAGIEKAFLPIKEVFTDGSYVYYIQPQILQFAKTTPHCSNFKVAEKHESKYIKLRRQLNGTRLNSIWFHLLYQYYGWNFTKKFVRFIKMNRINDLHNNNVGFLGKRPIILDYAGWGN